MKWCLLPLIGVLSTDVIGQQGAWEDPWFYFGNDPAGSDAIVAVHLIHLHTGKVLAITFYPPFPHPHCNPATPCGTAVSRVYLWTPPPDDPTNPGEPGEFENVTECRNYRFCAGHSAMAAGRILVAASERAHFNTYPFASYADDPGVTAWDLSDPSLFSLKLAPCDTAKLAA